MKQLKISKTNEVNPVFSFIGKADDFITFSITRANFRKDASNPIYMASILETMKKLKINDVYMPNIEHDTKIISVDENWRLNKSSFNNVNVFTTRDFSDAIISDEGKFLAIASADCMIATIVDVKTGIIAIAHVGWRGAIGDILLKTIDEILLRGNSSKENIKIFTGPSLKKENFEIKEDVKEIISDYCLHKKLNPEKYIETKNDEKWLFDQDFLVEETLLNYGILKENISISPMDTFSEPDISGREEYLYHSNRRDGNDSGRILVGIVPSKYYNNVLKSMI